MLARNAYVSCDGQQSRSHRSHAGDPVKLVLLRVVLPVATSGQPQRGPAQDVIAPEIIRRNRTRDFQQRGRSRDRSADSNVPTPAPVAPGKELRHLPQLRPGPLDIELHGSVAKSSRALPGAAKLQLSRIIQIHVAAERQSLKPDAPAILGLLPQ